MSKTTQSGGFLPLSLNENSFIKASEGALSLVSSELKESKNMGVKKIEDEIVDAGLSLLGKKFFKKFRQLRIQEQLKKMMK